MRPRALRAPQRNTTGLRMACMGKGLVPSPGQGPHRPAWPHPWAPSMCLAPPRPGRRSPASLSSCLGCNHGLYTCHPTTQPVGASARGGGRAHPSTPPGLLGRAGPEDTGLGHQDRKEQVAGRGGDGPGTQRLREGLGAWGWGR